MTTMPFSKQQCLNNEYIYILFEGHVFASHQHLTKERKRMKSIQYFVKVIDFHTVIRHDMSVVKEKVSTKRKQ